ncbi:MAG TPA: DSD1 family PLP-dependent enzyme [bacterium]|nr:DSD1 family PLP-dependent enzyme [bacterium]
MSEMVGKSKWEVDTPALLVDLTKLERNITKMAEFFKDKPAKLRPHWKTPKTVEIAKMQLKAGAIGITCAKVSEAEILVDAGIEDILIANEVVGRHKLGLLAVFNRKADVKCAVDGPEQVAMLAEAANAEGVTIGVVVDVFVGLPRCGVKPDDAPALAKLVAKSPGLKLRGVMGYEGHVVNMEDAGERRAEAGKSMGQLVRAAELIQSAGLPCAIVSGGGTGTYNFSGIIPGVTEIQAGSYCLMDVKYGHLDLGFENAATILSTVCSRSPALAGWTIIDAGMKQMTYEFGLPELIGVPGARLAMLSEEHGHLFTDGGPSPLKIGDKVELYPSHICTTVNLHDRMYAIRNGRVENVWKVAGRGRSQ